MKKAAGLLGLAFALAASPLAGGASHAASDREPYSCSANGRTYSPQEASVTIDVASGAILTADSIDESRAPASMTKMMTVALIFEALREGRLELDDDVTVRLSGDVRATRQYSNSTWLRAGTRLTVEEAILAIAVASANNVSVIMAEQVSGSEADFVAAMNEKARELGMQNTVFTNSSGIPDPAQVTTARDMAKLALHLYQEYPEYYHYFEAPTAAFGPYRGASARRNHNELAVERADIDGIKTGFICASGYNIAVSATNGDRRVITIVIGGRTPHQRNETAVTLIDRGFETLATQQSPLQNAASPNQPLPHINDDMTILPALPTPDGSPDAVHFRLLISGGRFAPLP